MKCEDVAHGPLVCDIVVHLHCDAGNAFLQKTGNHPQDHDQHHIIYHHSPAVIFKLLMLLCYTFIDILFTTAYRC